MTVAFASGGMLPDTASLVAAIAGLVAAVAGLVGACASLILARLAVRQNEQRERVEEQKRKAEEEKLEAEKRKREAEKDAQEAEEAASEAEIRKGELEIQLETIASRQFSLSLAPVCRRNAERTDYYFTFGLGRGTDNRRSWEEARRYGFVCAGGGTRWSRPLNLLEPGGRVWVSRPKRLCGRRVGGGPPTARVEVQSSDRPWRNARSRCCDASKLPQGVCRQRGDVRVVRPCQLDGHQAAGAGSVDAGDVRDSSHCGQAYLGQVASHA